MIRRRALRWLVPAMPVVLAGSAAGRPPSLPPLPATLALADGTVIRTAAPQGRVILVNYWARWCVPCRAELPLLARYYAAHRGEGLIVVGVSVDPGPAGGEQAVAAGLPYPQARRLGGRDFTLPRIPTSYAIDRHGRLRYARAATFTPASLDALLRPLLAERQDGSTFRR